MPGGGGCHADQGNRNRERASPPPRRPHRALAARARSAVRSPRPRAAAGRARRRRRRRCCALASRPRVSLRRIGPACPLATLPARALTLCFAFAPLGTPLHAAAAPAVLRAARHGQDQHRAGNCPTAVRPGADQEPRAGAQRLGRARHQRGAHQDQGLRGRCGGRAGGGVPEPAVQAADSGRGGCDDGGCAERAAAHHGAALQGDALLLHLQLRQPHHRPHRQPLRQVPVRLDWARAALAPAGAEPAPPAAPGAASSCWAATPCCRG